jgi:hypothetical protein
MSATDYYGKSANFIFPNDFSSESCTLTLNTNKRNGGSSSPNVEADGVTWGGVKWKEIKYVEE